jgi:hypothetical protein
MLSRLTLSLILWKSKTLSVVTLHASHSRYHFFSRTGLPIKAKYCKTFSSLNGSRSPSSTMLLFVRINVLRFGTERYRDGEMEVTRLLARSRVSRRFNRGRFPSTVIELSVRSMASCWSLITENLSLEKQATGEQITHSCNTQIFNGWYLKPCQQF